MKGEHHEPIELMSGETREMHRAVVSLMEELEAVDWYQQRADACADPQLKGILLHNKGEEIEHASMLMEWIRRHSERFDETMKSYLFTEKEITSIEAGDESAVRGLREAEPLAVGGLRGK